MRAMACDEIEGEERCGGPDHHPTSIELAVTDNAELFEFELVILMAFFGEWCFAIDPQLQMPVVPISGPDDAENALAARHHFGIFEPSLERGDFEHVGGEACEIPWLAQLPRPLVHRWDGHRLLEEGLEASGGHGGKGGGIVLSKPLEPRDG